MKGFALLLSALLGIGMLAGCGGQPQGEPSSNAPASAPSLPPLERAGAVPLPPTPSSQESNPEGVDVDLTQLSSIMVFAKVYDMMYAPEDYLGMTIKMQGSYYASYYEETKQYYHYVLIEDATACCQQGIEFIWEGRNYPDDFPADGTIIEMVGTFDSYEEEGITYYYLATNDVSILS